MPLHDFGTARAFATEDQVDVHFPKGNGDLRALMKQARGRWLSHRRCWRIAPQFARMDSASIVSRIEETLLASAPEGWSKALPRLTRFACVTRKYELKVGAGGIRITLPPGHPSDYALRKVPGAEKDRESWLVPAVSCVLPEMQPILKRVVREDREMYRDALIYVEGRSISGMLHIAEDEVAAAGLAEGQVVFAELSFMTVAEPQVPPAPILEYAFRVTSLERSGEGYETRMEYLDDEAAYPVAKARASQQPEERSLALNVSHAKTKWSYKRR